MFEERERRKAGRLNTLVITCYLDAGTIVVNRRLRAQRTCARDKIVAHWRHLYVSAAMTRNQLADYTPITT